AAQAPRVGAAQQNQVGLAGFDLGGRGNDFGQKEGSGDQRDRNDPKHGQQLQAADARNPQDDEFVALGQAGQRQDGADEQAYGQEFVKTRRQGQGLQIKQVQQCEFGSHIVQVLDQGEEGEEPDQR